MIPPYAGAAELAANAGPFGPPPAPSYILQEDAVSFILQEDGVSKLIQG